MIEVYTKDGCVFCTRAKALAEESGYEYKIIHMPRDISREDLMAKFPTSRTMPIITIDNENIGGYIELKYIIEERKAND